MDKELKQLKKTIHQLQQATQQNKVIKKQMNSNNAFVFAIEFISHIIAGMILGFFLIMYLPQSHYSL